MVDAWQSSSSHLLAALSDAVGQVVDVNEGGECVLAFDDGLEVALAVAREGKLLSLRTALTAAGDTLHPQLLADALSLNYTDMPPGYSVALDSDTGQLVLIALVDAGSEFAEHFIALVAGFVELAPVMREVCTALQSGAGE